jgi:hypothetical protein
MCRRRSPSEGGWACAELRRGSGQVVSVYVPKHTCVSILPLGDVVERTSGEGLARVLAGSPAAARPSPSFSTRGSMSISYSIICTRVRLVG